MYEWVDYDDGKTPFEEMRDTMAMLAFVMVYAVIVILGTLGLCLYFFVYS